MKASNFSFVIMVCIRLLNSVYRPIDTPIPPRGHGAWLPKGREFGLPTSELLKDSNQRFVPVLVVPAVGAAIQRLPVRSGQSLIVIGYEV